MYVLKNNSKEYAKKHVLYYDATVEFFGHEHLSYAIVALFVGVFIVILPIVFLIIHPMKWFHKCLNALKIQRQRLDMFVNCYQGYYKDGTNWYQRLSMVFCVILYISADNVRTIHSHAKYLLFFYWSVTYYNHTRKNSKFMT